MHWVRARTDNNLVRTLPASEATRSQLKVFISYSRKDSRFVGELIAGLNYDGNFSVLLDQRSIAEGEPWRARIVELIKQCEALVVILSEHWLGSDVGNWEVGLAWDNSKRVVPVLASSLGSQHPPDRIAAINFVRFDQEPTGPPRLCYAHLVTRRHGEARVDHTFWCVGTGAMRNRISFRRNARIDRLNYWLCSTHLWAAVSSAHPSGHGAETSQYEPSSINKPLIVLTGGGETDAATGLLLDAPFLGWLGVATASVPGPGDCAKATPIVSNIRRPKPQTFSKPFGKPTLSCVLFITVPAVREATTACT